MKQTNEINIIDVFNWLWDDRIRIFYIVGSVTVIAIIYAIFATPWYTSTVKILPSESENGGGMLNQYSGLAAIAGVNLPTSVNNYDLYPEIIESNFILDKVLRKKFKNSLQEKPLTLFEFWRIEIDTSGKDWEHILFEKSKINLRENYIEANIKKNNKLLTIEVSVPNDPVLSSELVNFIVENLNLYNNNHRKYKTSDQIIYIEKSLEASEKELKFTERKMQDFLVNNKDYSSPENKIKYERLKTEVDVQKTIYIELRKQLKLTEIERIKETETLNILDYGEVPIERSKPGRALIIIMGFIIGLITYFTYITLHFIVKQIRIK